MASKLVELLARIRAKVKVSNSLTFDSTLDKLDHIMFQSLMISGHLNGVAAGKVNKRRRMLALILIFYVYGAQFWRSVLVFLATITDNMLINDIVGGHFLALGTVGKVLQFWVLSYTTFILIVATVTFRAETRKCCHLFTDFRNVSNVTLVANHLTPENFQKFKVKTRLALIAIRIIQVICYATVCQFEIYGIYRTHQVNQSWWQLINTICWGLHTYIIWLWHGSLVVIVPAFYMYLSAHYFGFRYQQIVDKLRRVLEHTPKFDRELVKVIGEYDEVNDQVLRHNYIVKWILFVFNFILGMFAAVSLFAPIYVKFESELFRYAVIGCGGQFVMINIFFARIAASVYKNVSFEFEF